MTCPRIEDWTLMSMDVLDEPQAEEMRGHLEICRDCRDRFDEACRGHADLLCAYGAMDRDHDGMREKLMASLPQDGPKPLSTRWHVRGWRWLGGIVMDHPRTRRAAGLFTAAAIVVIAMTFFVSNDEGMAFSRVIERIRQTLTMKCRITGYVRFNGRDISIEGSVYISKAYGTRCDLAMEGRTMMTVYKPVDDDAITLYPPFKSCLVVPLEYGDASVDHLQNPDAFLKRLRTMSEDSGEPLGPSVVEGRDVMGFEIKAEKLGLSGMGASLRLYVDAGTALPARISIEMLHSESGMRMELHYDRFEWDALIDAGVFEPEIPGDYARSTLIFPPQSEEALVEGLNAYAELTGAYPEELDSGRVSAEMNRRGIAYLAGEGESLPPDAFKALPQKIMAAVSGCRFYGKLIRDGHQPKYFGRDVRPGAAGAVLLKWRLENGMVRKVYGDLRIKTVAP